MKTTAEENPVFIRDVLAGLPAIVEKNLLTFDLDYLQEGVYHNLHLEFPQLDPLAIIKPSLAPLEDFSSPLLKELLAKQQSLFRGLRKQIIEDLIEYTTIIESNSYFLHNNNFLFICRCFVSNAKPATLRNHFYTIEPRDIKAHYSDKIYLGTDQFVWGNPHRPHGGLLFYTEVVAEGFAKLIEVSQKKLKDLHRYDKIYLAEIRDLVGECNDAGRRIIRERLPKQFQRLSTSHPKLKEYIRFLRSIKHLLIELINVVSEFENVLILRDEEFKFANYVSKYKKDLTNFINYLNLRILRRLMYMVNGRI